MHVVLIHISINAQKTKETLHSVTHPLRCPARKKHSKHLKLKLSSHSICMLYVHRVDRFFYSVQAENSF